VKPISIPINCSTIQSIQDPYLNVVDLHHLLLIELLAAANFMGIEALLDLTSLELARYMCVSDGICKIIMFFFIFLSFQINKYSLRISHPKKYRIFSTELRVLDQKMIMHRLSWIALLQTFLDRPF
jgi:hypothetical protein